MSAARVLRRLALALLCALATGMCAAADEATPPAAAASAPREVLVMLRSPPEHARVDGSYGASGYGDAARAQSQARVGARLAAAHGLTVVTLWAMPALGMDCVVLALPPEAGLEASIAALQLHAEVAWAQPMNEFHAQGHSDPLYTLQPAATQWHLDDLHTLATGRRVHVAIIDSGVDDTHPDLAHAVQTRANFVDDRAWVAEQHGTAVAGLVAARADNGIGMVGIAPDARLYALRACWEVSASRTLCNSLSLAKALSFAIERRAEVINMSLAGPDDLLLGRLIDAARAQGQQVVAAVDTRLAGGGFPAAHPGVIAVADAQDDAAAGGLAGAWTAPARDLPTTAPGGGWRMVSGTSFAAGEVSGLLAVMHEARASADGRAAAPAPRLVRLPGGGIDACASLLQAAEPTPATHAAIAPGCRAVLAALGAPAGRSP
jgi:subtilisin family serine protease